MATTGDLSGTSVSGQESDDPAQDRSKWSEHKAPDGRTYYYNTAVSYTHLRAHET